MPNGRWADEFNEEAVKQVIERGYAVAMLQGLYKGVQIYSDRYEVEPQEVRRENLKLKAELRRAQEERGILKKIRRVRREKTGVRYRFIREHQGPYAMQPIGRQLAVSRSGSYAWMERPPSQRSKAEVRRLRLICELYEARGRIYGAPRMLCERCEVGERVGQNRIAKLIQRHKIRGVRGYKPPGVRYPKPAGRRQIACSNRLRSTGRRVRGGPPSRLF